MLLSGGNWAGARLMNAALRDALIDWFIADYEQHGRPYPAMDRDANASFVDRQFEDSHYETIHNQRDEARADLAALQALDAQRQKNTQYLIKTVDDLNRDIQLGRHNTQEIIEKINTIVSTLSASSKGKPKRKEEPQGFGQVVEVTDDEILKKMQERQERQAEAQIDEAKQEVDGIVSFLIKQGAMYDPQRARSLVADVSRPYRNFGEMFHFAFKPYLDSKDFIIGKVTPLQLSKLFVNCFQLQKALDANSIKTYFYQWFDKYQSGEL